ncbi:cell-death-related nuclease 7-like [Amblyomma americanum]
MTRDVYKQEVVRYAGDTIAVQSWRRGPGGPQDKDCSGPHGVTDVGTINLKFAQGQAVEFSTAEDHSKWDVALRKGFFCVSSLNRALSQFKRGGEVTCIWDDMVAQLFRDAIAERSHCGKAE